jgi:thioredoxin reductase (NADPH)
MHFAKYAKAVVMLVRGESLAATMSHYLIEQIEKTQKIAVWAHANLIEVHGDKRLEAITIVRGRDGTEERLEANSLFIFIGALPRTEWLAGIVERDEKGFVLSGPDLIREGQRPAGWPLDRDPTLLETSVPGIFVVGDVRHGSVKRVASGVGEGAVVVQFIHKYLAKVQ